MNHAPQLANPAPPAEGRPQLQELEPLQMILATVPALIESLPMPPAAAGPQSVFCTMG